MSRITLAFACFFKLLFGGKLPARAADYLPEEVERKALPAGKEPEEPKAPKAKPDVKEPEPKAKPAEVKVEPAKPAPAKPKLDSAALHRDGALALLALLQREGRLVDFLRENVDDYDDADIGAAVRDIHRGCKKVLDDYLELEAVMPGEEEDEVKVPKGFDPTEVRLVGEVNGEPPFKGVLRHHGWRAAKVKLPTLSDGIDRTILAPAEVEV